MANQESLNVAVNIDLENEIPFTAIVDINQTTIENSGAIIQGTALRQILSYQKRLNKTESKERSIESIIDIKYLCRICLVIKKDMVSLLSNVGNNMLADMYSAIASVHVNPDENLPYQICTMCHKNVVRCYNFKTKCRKANNHLMNVFKTQKIKHESQIKSESLIKNIEKETQTDFDNSIHNNYEKKVNYIQNKECHNDNEVTGVKNEIKVEEYSEEIEYLEDEFLNINTSDLVQVDRNEIKLEPADPKKILQEVRLNNKEKKRQHGCEFCSKKFKKTKTLRDHVKQFHKAKPKNPFACSHCKESFNSEHDLHIHSPLHIKGKTITCIKCQKEFAESERSKFRRHIRHHMQCKRHACECGKAFAELSALRRHTRVHTGLAAEKKHACQMCDKRFADSSQLATHMSRHTGARPCACDACGKAFPSRRLLASHRLVHSDHKPYKCDFCDKRFRHESTRNTHHRTHTGEKPFVCSVCGKTFIQSSNLKLHMRTHTGEKPYACDVCGHKFTSGSSLSSHRRTHTGEKPYSCHICGKKFARMDLREHMRAHSGERPYECYVCPKRFVSAARLREHCLIHTGEKPFECAICSEKFKRKAYLAKHIKNHEKTKKKDKEILYVQEIPFVVDHGLLIANNDSIKTVTSGPSESININNENHNKDVTLEVSEEIPLEVSGELILQDDGDVNTKLVVVDNNGENTFFENSEICLNGSNININDVNLVTVNEDEVNISSSSMLDGTTVKLYQLDQSLVQIETVGGNVTIRKITSKMTANF